MKKDVEILENAKIPESQIIMLGLPDTGLVGVIATAHILEMNKMEYLGSIDSIYFPPMIVIHNGELMAPMRIYGKDNIISLVSEITVPVNAISEFVEAIVAWLEEKKPKLVLFLGGLPAPNRLELEKSTCYAIPTTKDLAKLLERSNIPQLVEGVMVGPYALLLKECKKRNIPSIALLSESYANYPDPGAAASVIEALNKILDLNVEVESLLKKADEIRLNMRDLMRRTVKEMKQAEKTREYELPPLYM
ncbi:MAG: proteasome assembly chaperone family protein [Candidatus Odinarchaeum yellowstonii]|uniref:Proteasome assembly chaperone family protein n=1 Tax=Odinarchaeota yellowstonii (strain LCB_4) TaxID=1841599 RepID=A0AAF0D117_ODILC|nr:MAG: proteasome assembly chaperone family protein [Candidatus Odinarchaeum yellowstonii]